MIFWGFWDWFETVVSLFNLEILLSAHALISEADILHLEYKAAKLSTYKQHFQGHPTTVSF